jgi:cbb3-type cytochrome oxidase maturation protein
VAFIWAVRSGQYEDTCTPSMRLLVEEDDLPDNKQKNMAKKPKHNE